MNSAQLRQFQSGFSTYNASKMRKAMQGNVRLFYSKFLETASRSMGTGIRRRAKLLWGDRMYVIYPDATSVAIARYGFYEEGLTRMVLEYLKPGMTFLDVGAHLGYFTLLSSWLVGDEGQVHGFEPTPSTFAVLSENTKLKPNVHLNNIAVSSAPGTVTFNDYGTSFMGFNSMFRGRMDDATLQRITPEVYEVSSTSIDNYVAQEGLSPDFIKLDAESAEHEILEGMTRTLDQFRPIVSIEVGDMDIQEVPPSRTLVTHLIEKDYLAYEFRDGEIVEHQTKEQYGYDNLLFIPENHPR